MRPLLGLASILLFCSLSACFEAPIIPERTDQDADNALPTPRLYVAIADRLGRTHESEAPTWPLLRIGANVPVVDPGAAILVHGLSYDTLLDDLTSSPLRAATRGAAISTRTTVDDAGILLEPLSHLRRGGVYLLGVGAWAVEDPERALAPLVVEVRVSTDEALGAWAAESWPADSTHGVPRALSLVAVRFDGAVHVGRDALQMAGPGGEVAGHTEEVACREIGWTEGTCARFHLDEVLLPASTYRISVDESFRDPTGAPVGPFTAELTTAAGAVDPVDFVNGECGLDEFAAGPACVFVDDQSVMIRVSASGPARFFVDGGGMRRGAVSPRGAAQFVVDGLAADEEVALTLSLVDLAGHESRRTLRTRTTPTLPPIAIVAVCSDPVGPEPAQEYVELLNSGAMPIDLAGFALADREDRIGDIVSRTSIVPAGGRALLVSDAFDPMHPEGPAVPAGVPLVRIGTSLGSGGLSNAGEALSLRDPTGQRVSAAPALATGAGRCLVRTSTDLRRGDVEAFEVGVCTPGRPP